MKLKRIAGVAAALLLGLSMAGPALADAPTNQTEVNVPILEADTFFVEITSASSDFPAEPFHLGYNVGNWGFTAYYDYTVTDGRGSGDGWTVQASATDFEGGPNDALVPGANLFTSNESSWNPTGFTTGGPDDIATGVSVGPQDSPSVDSIIAVSDTIITGTPGVNPVSQKPNATGSFSAKETMWFTFPDSVAAGTYTSILTLTLTSGLLP